MNLKKRIAVFLCLLLVLPTLLQSLPGLTLEANAAGNTKLTTSLPWSVYTKLGEENFFGGTYDLTLEVGQEIDFSSYFFMQADYTSVSLSKINGEKYSSSNKKVASITKSGVLTAKKEGKTYITVKYKGQSIKVNIKVVTKKYTENKKIEKLNSSIEKAWKKYGKKKITAKNVTDLYNDMHKIKKNARECDKLLGAKNTFSNSPAILSYTVFAEKDFNYYILVDYEKYKTLSQELNEFCSSKKNSIVATVSTKNLSAKSVKVNGKKLTVNLNKKLTTAHMIPVAVLGNNKGQITSKSGLKIEYSIYEGSNLNVNTFERYGKEVMAGTVTLKPGNKTITVTMKHKLAKGNYYVAFYNSYRGHALSCSKAFTVK